MPDSGATGFLEPTFFNQYSQETIETLIDNDELFKIAGIVLGVNYQLTE